MHGRGDLPPDAAHWSPTRNAEWHAARDAVAALRDVLTLAGMEREFPYLRADLNAFGHGLIELGRISPETAERLARLLRLALDHLPKPADQEENPG
ncbi:hypothetical protein [Streptomyces aidingensis]|uniref:Uncharacterized protein n=1 Tax=Streptomyces aidingensis TaxID=910347 RepID=A0A1I1V5P9_9ACTN|nr:hypothetical protein [Streptomyces aidingensis]SFD78219.1 hypothetical protein SAMN05421773_13023 [Streptomyces aidingensis]